MLLAKRNVVALLLPWLLFPSSAWATRPLCVDWFGAFEDRTAELASLIRFQPNQLAEATFTPLGVVGHVVRVDQPNGPSYVVRFSSPAYNDVLFESFASSFISSAPGGNTPQIRVLTSAETAAVFQYLPQQTQRSLTHANQGRLPERASVAAYFPIPNGRETVPEATRNPLRRFVLEWAACAPSGRARVAGFLMKRLAETGETREQERNQLLSDLRSLGPAFAHWTPDNMRANLEAMIRREEVGELPRLVDRMFAAVSPDIQRQLANQVALYSVLGIPDAHDGNWLHHRGNVLFIDLALSDSVAHPSLPLPDQQLPISSPIGNDTLLNAWAARVSPEMAQFLRSLTREQVRQTAALTEYQLSDAALDALLSRRDNFVRRIPSTVR